LRKRIFQAGFELLKQVTANGIAHGYSCYRVDRDGNASMIHEGNVWTLIGLTAIR
jgi:hypothetical protein